MVVETEVGLPTKSYMLKPSPLGPRNEVVSGDGVFKDGTKVRAHGGGGADPIGLVSL